MVVESSQSQYKGAGYNDLDLNMFSKPMYARSNTSNTSLGGASSASVSANTSVTNLSSTGSLPPPPPIGVPRSRKASGETKRASAEPEEPPQAMETNVSEADLVAQMEAVLKKDSGLPGREFDHYCVKLRKLLPGLDQESRDVASHALVLAQEGKGANAKELLVQFMLRQSGSSSWAMPLRKVVESTK